MISIDQLAQQSADQGNRQLADYTNKAAGFHNQYNDYQRQADTANKGVSDYTEYMKNEGSAGNQYNNAFDQQKKDLGYDEGQMTAARGNLNQSTGALSAYSDFANQAASKWGMNAGGFAAANAGALGGLNNNIASNQGVVNGLHDIYKTAQTGANQKTGLVIQGEHETLGGLQSVFANASSQRDSAAQQMTFYDDLASKQGGLNAQQQHFYAQSKLAYASAQQAMAQTSLLMSQTAGQNLKNKYDSDAQGSQAYKDMFNKQGDTVINTGSGGAPTPNAGGGGGGGSSFSWTNPSSSWHAATSRINNNPSLGNTVKGASDVIGAGVSGLGWLGKKAWNG